ncbi:MAG: CRISPR-associated ring nuclease Crn3/Csx3 [Candidatus Anstonellales archaeon]
MCIEFKIKENENFVILEFELKRELEPKDLNNISPPDPIKNKFSSKGVVLSGRGPVWLYGFLVHYYHPTRFIGVYEPRLNSAVVIESHCVEYKVGDVIKL